ncbi:MAG: helix-turn-helix domain-containing protein [Nostoc sp.]
MQRCPKRIQQQSDKNNGFDKDQKPTHISMADATQLLHLDRSTVRYHIIRKRIRAFKSGGKWWLSKDDVETFKKWNK